MPRLHTRPYVQPGRTWDSVINDPNTRNWCPSFQEEVLNTLFINAQCNLADLEPSPLSAHFNCTRRECKVGEGPNLGRPQHTDPDCQCELVGPPLEDVEKLVREGRIPLVRIKRSLHGQMRIEVEQATFESRYVAISHVWTGGLGNANENKLYTCQLEEIAASGKQIRKSMEESREPSFRNPIRTAYRIIARSEPSLYWIDTLCIPTKKYKTDEYGNQTRTLTDKSREVRRLALKHMTQIYAYSHSVLVIDPELRRIPSEWLPDNPKKIFGLIRRSDWLRRCWTYQEGSMARRLFIKLSGGKVLFFNRERHKFAKKEQDIGICNQLTKWFSEMPAPREIYEHERELISGEDPVVFARIWNSLRTRQTTWERDRIVIFALMMNLVPGQLLELEDQAMSAYMRVLFNSLNTIPMDFIFERGASSDGFWLPSQGLHRTVSLTSGQLRRESFEKNELVFDRNYALAYGDLPALYILPHQSILFHLYFSILAGTDSRWRYFELEFFSDVHAHLADTQSNTPLLALLLQNTRFNDSNSTKGAIFEVLDSGSPQDWNLKRICGVHCRGVDYPPFPVTKLESNLLAEQNDVFRIQCDFNNTVRLPGHRHPNSIVHPGPLIFRNIFMNLSMHIFAFNLLYGGITAAIAMPHSQVHFSPLWFVFIFMFGSIQLVVQMYNMMILGDREGDKVTHMRWLNDLAPSNSSPWPSIFPRRAHGQLRINYSPLETIFRLSVSLALVIVGIVYHSRPNRRWLTAWGMMIFLEVLLRWIIELVWIYRWKLRRPDSHIIIQEILRPSWLSRQLQKIGWLKEPSVRSLEEGGIEPNLDHPFTLRN